jgi:deoxyribose-phosphate aldolase
MISLPKNSRQVAALIDHTLLKPEVTRRDIDRICGEAIQRRFASVCVNPVFVPRVVAKLHDTPVKTCTVIGFPLGANLTAIKVAEAKAAVKEGAQELDMVIQLGALKAGDDELVAADIHAVAAAAHTGKAICKVIIETCLLTNEEKERACRLAVEAGADFVKTSTGFSSGGATLEDVALMRRVVGAKIGVKASGGVRSLNELLKMVEAGATRIGTSTGVKLVEEARTRFGS